MDSQPLDQGLDQPDSIDLSFDRVLIFVLRSGCVGRLTSGRIVRDQAGHLRVFGPSMAVVNDYVSGVNLRSWSVVKLNGETLGGWSSVLPEDRERISAKFTSP
ncbi:MAG: hypothetical protein U0Q18_36185 [Bryobacteraceae bacterium]